MKKILTTVMGAMPGGARLLVLAYALGLIGWLGIYFKAFDVYQFLALSPARVWKGEVWRLVTYAFLPGGIVEWLISLFWLITLTSVLGRNWSGSGYWGFCLLAIVGGALPIVIFKSDEIRGLAGCLALIFGLLVAWDRIYERERMLLLGWGEISVRQAAILVALINVFLLFFCNGWFITLAMLTGGVAAYLYFKVRDQKTMRAAGQAVSSERIARLEL